MDRRTKEIKLQNTFLNRVSAERRVLSKINSYTTNGQQLTGLSRAAIAQWQSRGGIDSSSPIIHILKSVAEACQRLSDRSNETFSPVEASDAKEIEKQIATLEKALRTYPWTTK
jgi:hypothetical protein